MKRLKTNKRWEQKDKVYSEILGKVRKAVHGYKLNDVRLALNRFYKNETERKRLMEEIKENQNKLSQL